MVRTRAQINALVFDPGSQSPGDEQRVPIQASCPPVVVVCSATHFDSGRRLFVTTVRVVNTGLRRRVLIPR